MAKILFDEAKDMATNATDWMQKVSDYINDPLNPKPTNIYSTQKLAFEIDKNDLTAMLEGERAIGILGYEGHADSLTVILVSLDNEGRPTAGIKPRQTWPLLKDMSELEYVLSTYLTPKV